MRHVQLSRAFHGYTNEKDCYRSCGSKIFLLIEHVFFQRLGRYWFETFEIPSKICPVMVLNTRDETIIVCIIQTGGLTHYVHNGN